MATSKPAPKTSGESDDEKPGNEKSGDAKHDAAKSLPTTASSEGPAGQSLLSNRMLGAVFLVYVGMLAVCIAFSFVYFVIVSLESPKFLDEYVRTRSDVPAQMTIALEYDSRTMKTMGVQIAFGFLVGLILSGIGVLLFAAGANGSMQMKGNSNWLPITLSATTPGLAIMVLGGVIIALAVSKDVRRNMAAEMQMGSSFEQSSASPTTKKQPEGSVSTPPHEPKGPPSDQPE